MMSKTQKEIGKEIEALKAIRPRVKPYTYFGDDNLAALDAQIEVLEQDLDSDDIWDRWPGEESDIHIRGAADSARDWIDGESEYDSLVEEQPLEKREDKENDQS